MAKTSATRRCLIAAACLASVTPACGGALAGETRDSGASGDSAEVAVDAMTTQDVAMPDTDIFVDASLDGGFAADGQLSTVTPTVGEIACGATVCRSNDEVCCIASNGALSCTSLNGCRGSPFVCSGAESCAPGEQCCANWGVYVGYVLQSTTCGACDSSHPQVCTSTSQCMDGATCVPAASPDYGVCTPYPDD
jgi:hypothetical protein